MYGLFVTSSSKYCYAYKNINFLGYEKRICTECGRYIASPKFNVENDTLLIEGGKLYPDFLEFTGAGVPMFIVSSKILDLFERYNITGYNKYQKIDILRFEKNTFETIESDICYYSLTITGEIELDYREMLLKKKNCCSSCQQFNWNREKFPPVKLDMNTWNGEDLCRIKFFSGFTVCSDKMLFIIKEHRLKGGVVQNENQIFRPVI